MKANSPVKILLVDDLPENLFALELILTDKNYFFVKANSGNEALKILLHEQDFAIILMDVQMPEMDGFETVELIRESETLNHVPIIFLTASMDNALHISKGYQAGGVDFMIKPLVPEILTAKVAVFVDLYLKTHQLLFQNEEKKKRADELIIANKELVFQNEEKGKRAAELVIANKELLFQDQEKEKRADELIIANEQLVFQNQEREKRAYELMIANKELAFQNQEKEKRADELVIANKELIFQNEEKEKRAGELMIANKELIFQDLEKGKRAGELIIANKELAFQNEEKEKRAGELFIANKELVFQNNEKEKRAAELIIANKELVFQNEEKEKRADELIIANLELVFQNEEKEKRAAELVVADLELVFQNKEKENREIDARKLEAFNLSIKRASLYSRSLIEASTDPLITISPEGKITDINEASVKVTGETRDKLIGTDFSDYFTEPKKAREGYKQVFEKGFVSDYPLTIHHKNGKLTDVLYNASVYKDEEGNVLGVFAAARDVTEMKKIAKEISDYKNTLDEFAIVAITDKKGIISNVNDNFCKISKYNREELIGQDHRIINSGYHSKDFIRGLWTTIAKGEIWKGEIKNKAKDGTIYWVDTTIVPFLDEHGKPNKYVAVRTDITNQKTFTEELTEAKMVAELAMSNAEKAKGIAERALQSKQQFLSNMSHEIRTPMNAILGFTKILLKADFTPKQKEYLDAIKTSSDGLLVLINDILDLAKVDAGKMTFEQKPFKIEFSIATMHQVFDLKLKEKNLELVKEYDIKIPAVLLGDAARLHQILLNLLGNAIKFTAKGKITVAVRLLHEDNEKATIEFAITDTGTGIAEDKLESIFENFQQATTSISSSFGGTGLGLAICKQLVEKQGGSISVKSTMDEGSTFSFTLSFQKTNEENEKESGKVELEKEIKDIKILVVEDVKLNQLLMKIILDDFKFKYDIADNGKIAIEKMQTNTYDIILMDLQMPEMNGFEATEYIRNTMESTIPIIALTADVTAVDVEKCKVVGMNDYVSKPLDERILYTKIMDLLKH